MTTSITLAQLLDLLPDARLEAKAEILETRVVGVSSDSRALKPGELFIALTGERFNGHTFLSQALLQGACAALVSTYHPEIALPQIQVADTRIALRQLAAAWRRKFDLPLVLVTGSNGKTTVKEMLSSIFAHAVKVSNYLATSGNYNNDIGLPLTLLQLNAAHRFAVIELGMNHPGETVVLADIALPTVVLINNAQREHQEFMASVKAVAEEHGSAIDTLPATGSVVFPADSEYSGLWRQLAGRRQVIDFALLPETAACAGAEENPALMVSSPVVAGQVVSLAADHSVLKIRTTYGTTTAREVTLTLPLMGKHNLQNALAACAAALAVGIDLETISAGLQTFSPVKGRLQIITRAGLTVIDDSYNANPDSVRAAIDVLATMPMPRTLILGDMGEVGERGVDFHQEIGAYARARGVNKLLAAGPLSVHACQAFGSDAQHFADAAILSQALQAQAYQAQGTVLVKGSRFMRMEQILPLLQSSSTVQSKSKELPCC